MPKIPAQTRLIIFDCDGVLVDSEALSNAVMAVIYLNAAGEPLDGAETARHPNEISL